jgi:hypothetical protein
MLANVSSDNLDCEFELEFDGGMSDSSIGLEIWDPLEHSITFRGGVVKVVSEGSIREEVVVGSYTGKPIRVHLQASDDWLLAEIDGDEIVNEPNTYWKGVRLQPRLNADIGDTITLDSSSCTTK